MAQIGTFSSSWDFTNATMMRACPHSLIMSSIYLRIKCLVSETFLCYVSMDGKAPPSGNGEMTTMSATLVVRHKVNDYAAWRKVYDELEPIRARHGCTAHGSCTSPRTPMTC